MPCKKIMRSCFNIFLISILTIGILVSIPSNPVLAAQPVKSLAGWEYQNPSPQTSNLMGIWGASAGNVFAVGEKGNIVHYDGAEWNGMISSTAHNLKKVWGSSGSDVFAVGSGGVILHYDGNLEGQWEPMISGSDTWLYGIWGTSDSNVYAVGDDTILHYDGNRDGVWTPMPGNFTQEFNNIWGSSETDIYVVGSNLTLLHSTDEGATWTPVDVTGLIDSGYIYDIWGSSATDVYAVGHNWSGVNGFILHYDGISWSMDSTHSNDGFFSIWGSSNTSIFSGSSNLVYHYDGAWHSGAGLDPVMMNYYVHGIWGDSGTDVFAVGGGGSILHSTDNGSNWSSMISGVTTQTLNGVWGSSDNNVYCVGDAGTVLHSTDAGNNWNSVDVSSLTSNNLNAIWGKSADNILVAGSAGTILKYNGADWSKVDSGVSSNLLGVWGNSGSNDVFAAGESNTILHSSNNGADWTPMNTAGLPSVDLFNIWGTSASDVFAVGFNSTDSIGVILHYDGSEWSSMDLGGVTNSLSYVYFQGIWGSSRTDVYVAGSAGTLLHYDGSGWSSMYGADYNSGLYALWGDSGSDVFAVGGEMLHYNGTAWSSMASGTSAYLNAIWGSSFSNVFTVGYYGTILHGVMSQAISNGAAAALQAGGSSVYIDMNAGQSASFVASEQYGFPPDGFVGMGYEGGTGFSKILSVTGNAADGSFIALVQLHYSDAELASSGMQETDLRLYARHTSQDQWIPAVEGNTAGAARWMGDALPPSTPLNAAVDLGKYGVDSAHNLVWAVVDYTAEFAGGLKPISTISLKQGSTLIANPGVYNFGGQIVDSSQDVVFTIEYSGDYMLMLGVPLEVTGADAGQFSLITQPDWIVGPGGSTSFTVRFSPDSTGLKTASIEILNSDRVNQSYELNLVGNGGTRTVGGEITGINKLKLAFYWAIPVLFLVAGGVIGIFRRRKAG